MLTLCVVAIASLVDRGRGMPTDLSCEPRDCLLLYKAMVKFENDQYPVPKSLAPQKALPSIIKKADIFKWEKDLKVVLLNWMTDRSSPFDKVLGELITSQQAYYGGTSKELKTIPAAQLSPHAKAEQSEDSDTSANGIETGGKKRVDQNSLLDTTLPLLVQLHQRHALPAILFNYERSMCEKLGRNLLKQLTEAETSWKESSESWKKTMRDFEKYQELKDAKQVCNFCYPSDA